MRYVKLGSILLGVLVLAGCAGRIANTVTTERPLDHDLSCPQIRAEIAQNDDQIHALNLERAAQERYNRNTAASYIPLWLPGLFALDKTVMKDGEHPQRTEALAYKARNDHLIALQKDNGC